MILFVFCVVLALAVIGWLLTWSLSIDLQYTKRLVVSREEVIDRLHGELEQSSRELAVVNAKLNRVAKILRDDK